MAEVGSKLSDLEQYLNVMFLNTEAHDNILWSIYKEVQDYLRYLEIPEDIRAWVQMAHISSSDQNGGTVSVSIKKPNDNTVYIGTCAPTSYLFDIKYNTKKIRKLPGLFRSGELVTKVTINSFDDTEDIRVMIIGGIDRIKTSCKVKLKQSERAYEAYKTLVEQFPEWDSVIQEQVIENLHNSLYAFQIKYEHEKQATE